MRRAFALLAVLGLLGCTDTPAAAPDDPGTDRVVGSWDLASGTLDGTAIDLTDMPPVVLSAFESGGHDVLGGEAVCNGYGAPVSYGATIELGVMTSSAVGCTGKPGEVESAYYEALARVDHADLEEGSALVLTAEGVELTYRPTPEVPLDEVLGVRWTLESADPPLPAHPPWPLGAPWVEYRADHTVVGSTGCRTIEAEWSIWRGDLNVQGGAGATGECRPAFYRAEAFTLPTMFPRLTLDGDRLVVTPRFGPELTYVKVPRRHR